MKKKDPIAALLQNPMSYLYQKKEKNIVAISSRIRLARNIAQFPFPVTASVHDLAAVRNIVEDAVRDEKILGAAGLGIYLDELSDIISAQQGIIFERQGTACGDGQ